MTTPDSDRRPWLGRKHLSVPHWVKFPRVSLLNLLMSLATSACVMQLPHWLTHPRVHGEEGHYHHCEVCRWRSICEIDFTSWWDGCRRRRPPWKRDAKTTVCARMFPRQRGSLWITGWGWGGAASGTPQRAVWLVDSPLGMVIAPIKELNDIEIVACRAQHITWCEQPDLQHVHPDVLW